MTLYYIGHKKSKEINAYLAVTDNEETAQQLLQTVKGATEIVVKQYDHKGNLIK